ncbi:hypothetical protein [Ornithinibacillus scapharcae]|uniref:hypothetical protein n=1 Tax=Ornithinibacillus scapharcae TaxID=1147159 RepID=UPI000225B3F5|nr:hypothetical protein [Ornithinibacillus scapharcae]
MIRILLAGIFSLIYPGIGQLYNRQWLKGIAFVLVELCLVYFAPPELWLGMIYRIIWLLSIIDAAVVAYLVHKGRKELIVYRGRQAVLVVGLAILIVRPIALLPSLIPHISFNQAVKQLEEVEEGSEEQLEEEKKIYMQYLEETYGEQFEFGEASYNSNYGHYLVEAYPVSNPEIVFGVYQVDDDTIQDSYIDLLWEDEAKKGLSPIVEGLYEEIWSFDLNVTIKAGVQDIILSENDQLIGFNEGKDKYQEDYFYSVDLIVFQDYDNPERELEKLYDIITYFKEENIQVYGLEVEYYDIGLLKGKEIDPDGNYDDYTSHFISLDRDEIIQIKSASDIEKHLIEL